MIRADQLCKVFQAARGKTIEAVRDASFCVGPGEIYGLLGPNGAGKTTLLRMMATILAPTSGHCYVGDLRTDTDPEEARRRIGFLSGNTRLYGRLTPPEILRYFGRLYGMSSRAIRDRTDELSGLLGMEEFLGRRCETLSTGQTQKVSIARVILHDPPTLILDEPTLGLDIMTARTILQFILAAKQRGRSIIFSTHYMTEAELLCDRIGLIHRGTIRAEGTLGELCRLSGASNLVEAFLRIVEPGAAAEPAS